MSEPKKRILFVNSHFGIGGIESALVSMVNELCKYYDVDLLVYNPVGPMKEKLDPRVNIIEPCFALKAMGMSFGDAVRTKNPFVVLFLVFGAVWSRVFDNRFPVFIATLIQKKLKGYSFAAAYRQEVDKSDLKSGFVRVLDRCVEADFKAAWIHNDTVFFKNYNSFNEKYYKKVDKIIGVSRSVAEAFGKMNPSLSDKIDYCYNFTEYERILSISEKEQPVKYPDGKFICFSACRLSKGKAIERTVNAIAPIMAEHKDIMWYIAGEGPQRESIENIIKEKGLEKRIILLGNLINPYPYMKNSDLFMLTSYHEAAPIVYVESKILGVPVFATETLSSREMLEDGTGDFICENSEDGIRISFEKIINNREMLVKARESLANYNTDNAQSLRKITNWIK